MINIEIGININLFIKIKGVNLSLRYFFLKIVLL